MSVGRTIWLPVLCALLLAACDTARNMEDPGEKSYVRLIGEDGHQEGVDVAVSGGSIYILGNTNKGGKDQLYVVKTTAEGYEVWHRSLGGPDIDEAKDIELLTDGSLAVLGMVTGSDLLNPNRDFAIWLMTADGVVTDSVTFGGATTFEEAISISETSDGFVVTGFTNVESDPGDAFFYRFDSDLSLYDLPWNPVYGVATDFDVAVKTIEVGNLFYVFGYTNKQEEVPPGDPDDTALDFNVFVWLFAPDGGVRNSTITIGNRVIPGTSGTSDEVVSSVALLPGGLGYVVSGYMSDGPGTPRRMFAMKIRTDLEFVTDIDQAVDGDPRVIDDATSSAGSSLIGSIFPSQGSGFYVLGTKSESGDDNIYLKKLDNGLSDVWTSPPFYSFGGVGTDIPGAVAESSDGRIILVGTIVQGDANGQRKVLLMKLSPNGKLGE